MIKHSWNISVAEAVDLQKRLAHKTICNGKPRNIRIIAGVDLAYEKATRTGFCAVMFFSYPDINMVALSRTRGEIEFPYIPGLLTFREGPLVLKAFGNANIVPDIILFDGQGIAHPRRLGIAAHLGLLLDIASIGCAKSRLYGVYKEPGPLRGDRSVLHDGEGSSIGFVLRTKDHVRPIFVSPGYRVGINEAADIVMTCVTKYRIPEPIRIADIEVRRYKKECS